MAAAINAKQHVLTLLARGWRWQDADSNVLVHPEDHNLAARYDPADNTLSLSPALVAALDLVIPTPASQSRRFWRDEQRKEKSARPDFPGEPIPEVLSQVDCE